MGWFGKIFGAKPQAAPLTPRMIRAFYDAARNTPDSYKHWANADAMSADAAQQPAVRRTLRMRSRYEVANNSYARGIVLTLANDVIGTGPRLQSLLGDGEDDNSVNGVVEKAFTAWARAVDLGAKLRTMRMARAQDGEAFATFTTNPKLASPVKLDLRLIEADQVATPNLFLPTPQQVDGIVFDSYGNPITYNILRMHPGAMLSTGQMLFDPYPAESVLHWYRVDRPGQSRGLPDIMPALPLFAQLRRFTLAVLGAAEIAADQALVMKTTTPAGEAAAEVPNGAVMDFERNMAVFAPEGWEPYQIKAEQPATTYAMFKREILGEIARCLNLPFNVAACDSSSYNFASGQLDHQTYYRSLRVDQTHCEDRILDRILDAWLAEAATVYPELNGIEELPHQWMWDGRDVGNPIDLANAASTRLSSNTTTLSAEYAKQGKDWETELRQRAKEVALAKELGLTQAQTMPTVAQPEEAPPVPRNEEKPNAAKQKNAA